MDIKRFITARASDNGWSEESVIELFSTFIEEKGMGKEFFEHVKAQEEFESEMGQEDE